MGDPNFHGAMAFHVIGYPGAATSFDFLYQRSPRRLKYDGHEKYSSQDGSAILNSCSGTSAIFAGGVGAGCEGVLFRPVGDG